jgi:diguanylate cyclase (GGDEF)-like protein
MVRFMRIGGQSLRLWCAMLGFCLAFMLYAAPALASASDLTPCFRLAKQGETLADALAQPAGFNCKTHQNSLPSGDYWVRFQIPAEIITANRGLVFRTASLWDRGIRIWIIRADGRVRRYDPSIDLDIHPLRLGSTIVIPLQPESHSISQIIAHVRQSAAMRGVMQQSQLTTTEDALHFEMMLAVLYAAFGGLSIALLVYNLALWRGMRQPFLLAYCGMLLATLAYAFFTSGAPHYVWFTMSGTDRLRFTIPLLAINAASVVIFIRHFFMSENIPQWLSKFSYRYAATIAAVGLVYAALLPNFAKPLDAIYVASFIPLPIITLCYVVVAYKRRDPFLRYFLLAWTAPAIGMIARILYGMDILAYNILIENSTLIGLAIEALISSLAIGYRVRMLTTARDQAEMAEANALLMADTDALTALPNRRAFVRELLSAPRDWQLVLVDIDHFKRVNDTLGHDGGDEVLIKLAEILKANSMTNSLVARLGGEEFAIATIAPSDGKGLVIPNHILEAIRRTDMPGGYRVTASIGVARRVICEEMDWKILYRAADMALYRAKGEGRDRFVDYSAERIAA